MLQLTKPQGGRSKKVSFICANDGECCLWGSFEIFPGARDYVQPKPGAEAMLAPRYSYGASQYTIPP